MRYRLSTIRLFFSLLCLGLLCSPAVGLAQVYKSYDADGNVVFSDKPSDSSSEIEIRQPNVSDSIKVPPPSTTRSTSEVAPEPEPPPVVEEDSADTNNDGRISRREKEKFIEEQRRKRREAKKEAEGIEE